MLNKGSSDRGALSTWYLAGKHNARSGAAVVEFAVVAPVFFLLILGMIEFGRAMMSLELMANAARHGARTGSIPGKSNADISAAVNEVLAKGGIKTATTTIAVNNAQTDAITANSGDSISVTVSVDYKSVSWLPNPMFLKNKTMTESSVMRRE